MKNRHTIVMLLFSASMMTSPVIVAEDQVRDQKQETVQEQMRQQVFGWELMTPEERAQHREMMRNLKTEQERQAYRMEHHKRMLQRAKERGVELAPFQPRRGMGGGMGRGNQ